MINLLISDSITRQQEILTLINKPPAIVQQIKPELSIEDKIKTNFYKCNTDIQWIRKDNAQCLDKQNLAGSPLELKTADKPIIKGSTGLNGYEAGQCTAWVASKRYVPNGWGNATDWKANAISAGWTVSNTPVAGAIAWRAGHVAYVESVGNGVVTISEQNYDWNSGIRTITIDVNKYLYIY